MRVNDKQGIKTYHRQLSRDLSRYLFSHSLLLSQVSHNEFGYWNYETYWQASRH